MRFRKQAGWTFCWVDGDCIGAIDPQGEACGELEDWLNARGFDAREMDRLGSEREQRAWLKAAHADDGDARQGVHY